MRPEEILQIHQQTNGIPAYMRANVGGNEMHTVTIDVSPALAAEWLTLIPLTQRPRRAPVVARYAQDMQTGAWKLNHQGIAFNAKGELDDGQHRLGAIVLAGVTVRMRVTFNVPVDGSEAMDLGATRSASDTWGRSEVFSDVTSNLKLLAAVAIAVISAPTPVSGRAITLATRAEIVERFRGEFTFAMPLLMSAGKAIKVAPVCALLVRAAICGVSRDRIRAFAEILCGGVAAGPEDSAATALVIQLLKDGTAGGVSARMYAYKLTESALDSFIKRVPIKQVKPKKGNLFPLPPLSDK
jgi:hypothetical protein